MISSYTRLHPENVKVLDGFVVPHSQRPIHIAIPLDDGRGSTISMVGTVSELRELIGAIGLKIGELEQRLAAPEVAYDAAEASA